MALLRSFIPADDIGHIQHAYGMGYESYGFGDFDLEGHLGTGSAWSAFVGSDPESRVARAVQINARRPGLASDFEGSLSFETRCSNWPLSRSAPTASASPSAGVDNPQMRYSLLKAGPHGVVHLKPWLHLRVHGEIALGRRFEFYDGLDEEASYNLDSVRNMTVRLEMGT